MTELLAGLRALVYMAGFVLGWGWLALAMVLLALLALALAHLFVVLYEEATLRHRFGEP